MSRTLSEFSSESTLVAPVTDYGSDDIDMDKLGDDVAKVDMKKVLLLLRDGNGIALSDMQINMLISTGHFEDPVKSVMIIAEFGQLLAESDFDKSLAYLRETQISDDFTWRTPTIDSIKEFVDKVQEAEMLVIARDDIGTCTKCKSNLITVNFKQTARADESTSTFYRCASCKAGGRYITLKEGASKLLEDLIRESQV
jgi:DNA-directed RNA polymerase subunit M/transcription elongation factor TFIIS